MWLPRIVRAWLGLNPDLPFIEDVPNPEHGFVAKNSRHQKVIYDAKAMNNVTGKPGKWVVAGKFSG